MATAITIATFTVVLALAVAAAIEDTRTHLLRNIYTLPVIVISLLGLTTAGVIDGGSVAAVLTDMAMGVAWFAGPWLVTHLIAPKQIGFGDIKLSTGLGLSIGFLEPSLGFLGFFATSAVFGIGAVVTQATKREPLPFGPAIVIGAISAVAISIA